MSEETATCAGHSKKHLSRLLKQYNNDGAKTNGDSESNPKKDDCGKPTSAKKAKYCVRDVIDPEDEEGSRSDPDDAHGGDEMISIRSSDVKSLMAVVLKMSSDVSNIRKQLHETNKRLDEANEEIRNLAIIQAVRDKSYSRDLRVIKDKLQVKSKWPVPDYVTFVAMEKQLDKDTDYRDQLKLELVNIPKDNLKLVFDKSILLKYSLKGRHPLKKLESSSLISLVADLWAKDSKKKTREIFEEFDKAIQRYRRNLVMGKYRNERARAEKAEASFPPVEFVFLEEEERKAIKEEDRGEGDTDSDEDS